MRVLLSAYACRPDAGSEPGVGWNWATHLAARGMEVHVLVAKRNQASIEDGLRMRAVPNLYFNYVAVRYEWAKKNEALHYMLWQATALKAAKELSKTINFDVAHHVTYASAHVPSLLWRLGVPLIFGPVGGGQTAPAAMLRYFGTDRMQERARTILTKALRCSPLHRRWLPRMDHVLAANLDTLNMVRSLGCAKASLMCDTAIPEAYFGSAARNFEKQIAPLRLLWVGRMLTRKALPLALDALKEVKSDVTLTLAGDGLPPETIHPMIQARNLQGRVLWKGSRLTCQELRAAYSEHDAMLFTSLRDSFGSQVLEAMSMGLPIIALDLHGVHDLVPPAAALKVPVSDPEETVRKLANAIDTYASFPASRKNEMSQQAFAFANTLSWPARALLAEQLYQQVLAAEVIRKAFLPGEPRH